MLSRAVGAVQPVAVTSRSQSTVAPSAVSTARTVLWPRTLTMSWPALASSTRAISTPACRRSARAASPLALAVSTTARCPGLTAYSLMSRRTAVASITPGTSLPPKTYGRSIRPGATTRTFARALMSCSAPPGSAPRCATAVQLSS